MCTHVLTLVAYMSKRIYGGSVGPLPNGVVPCTRDVEVIAVSSDDDGYFPIGKRARPNPVGQSWIVHYLFGNTGIISILLPYLKTNARYCVNYGRNLLSTCSFVLNCGGGSLRTVAFGAAMRSFWDEEQGRRQQQMLNTLRWYTAGMRICLNNNPNLLEKWPVFYDRNQRRDVTIPNMVFVPRGVHLRSENLNPHYGLYMIFVGFTPDGHEYVECSTQPGVVNGKYKWYSLKATASGTRHLMAATATHLPELFDTMIDTKKFSKVYDILEPRMVRRAAWEGCKKEDCGVCYPRAGRGWVYVDADD